MNHSIEEVIKAAKIYLPNLNERRLYRAYEFAARAHEGQIRKEGSPYIVHPVSAAYILTGLRVDEDTLIGALLHDVPEDTTYTLEDIEKNFGKKIAFLVEGITKLSKVHYRHNMEERQIESLKKMFIHSAQDIRIILIKLADRLHNMSTIGAIPKPEKRTRIAKETLEIYVPIANLLGIWELKGQLEDLCFKTLLPEEFEHIEELAKESALSHSDIVKRSISQVKRMLAANHLYDFEIEGRKKTLYSIYRKMVNKGRSFHEIYDLIGIRVIVDDIGECYQVLGVLHQNYTPKLGRLKDYIAIPKSNGYQSIHTTIFGVDGALSEFQIRTKEMHLESEYGVAAHYFYTNEKDKKKSFKKMQKKAGWVKKILEVQRNAQNSHYLDDLKLDIFQDRIFVFTPKGDVIDLPKDANIIDMAFHVHSDLGRRAAGALLNGTKESLNTTLKTGDVVEIITSEESQAKIEWLYSVHANLSKHRIKEFLKTLSTEKSIESGWRILDSRIKVYGYKGVNFLSEEQKNKLIEKFLQKNWDLLLCNLGNGNINVNDAIAELFSKSELIGEEINTDYMKAYVEGSDRVHVSIAPPKIHKVHLKIETINRVGMLRDISDVIAGNGVNILKISTMILNEGSSSELEFFLEIRNINQYENLVYAIHEVPGVLKVNRVQSDESAQINSNDFHKELSQ